MQASDSQLACLVASAPSLIRLSSSLDAGEVYRREVMRMQWEPVRAQAISVRGCIRDTHATALWREFRLRFASRLAKGIVQALQEPFVYEVAHDGEWESESDSDVDSRTRSTNWTSAAPEKAKSSSHQYKVLCQAISSWTADLDNPAIQRMFEAPEDDYFKESLLRVRSGAGASTARPHARATSRSIHACRSSRQY